MATQPSTLQQLAKLDVKNLSLKDINFRRLLFVRRYLLISAGMGVMATILVFLVILPQVQQIYTTQQETRQESAALASLQAKIAGLRQVNDLKEYSSRDKVDLALPFHKPLIPLLDSSRRVSQDSGAQITAIETSPGKIGSASASKSVIAPVDDPANPELTQVHGVDRMNVKITITGSIDQINDFIKRIEQSTPATNVTEIQLKEAPLDVVSTSGVKIFDANLQLSSYYFTQAIEVAIDTPLPATGEKERTFLTQLENYTVTDSQVQTGSVEGGGRQDLFGTGQNALPTSGGEVLTTASESGVVAQ